MPEPEPIPFAEWTPDLSDRQNPTAEAKGVFSVAGQYAPFPDIQSYGPAALLDTEMLAVWLPFDGADAATTFPDDSFYATTWTAHGNAQIDDASGEFGQALLLDGTGDFIDATDSAAFTFGSGDWYIACWFECTATSGSTIWLYGQTNSGFGGSSQSINVGRTPGDVMTAFVMQNSLAVVQLLGTTQFTDVLNTGSHFLEVSRTGTTIYLFIDGVLEDSDSISLPVNDSSSKFAIGTAGENTTNPWMGWIDDFVITIGSTQGHTGAYTPPTSAFAPFGAGAGDIILGADTFYDSNTDPHIVFGDSSRLYTLVSRQAVDVSKAGGYSVGASDTWQFAQFGDFVLGVTEQEDPQVFEMGVSVVAADLTGSPPSGATSVARIGDFVWMGRDFTVHWSAINDHADWVPDPDTQAGNQPLDQERGEIMCLVGLDYAAIFQERAIRRAIYVGPPIIWDFGQDYVEKARGAISRNCAVPFGRVIFYVADDGFYAFDGQSSTPIGYGKIDSYFSRNLNYGFRHKVSCGIDYLRKLFVVGYPSGSAQNISDLLIFSIQDGRWTHDVIDLEFVFDTPAEPFTVDNFATLYPGNDLDMSGITPDDIDAASFDDRRIRLGAFQQTTHQLGLFVGSPRAATIDTREFEPAPGRRGLVTEIWPMGDYLSGGISGSVVYRPALPGTDISVSNSRQMNRAGYCPARIDARFMRARLQITAGSIWRRAEGVHVTAQPTGGR